MCQRKSNSPPTLMLLVSGCVLKGCVMRVELLTIDKYILSLVSFDRFRPEPDIPAQPADPQ